MPLPASASCTQENACLHHLGFFRTTAWNFVIGVHCPEGIVMFAIKDGRIYTKRQGEGSTCGECRRLHES